MSGFNTLQEKRAEILAIAHEHGIANVRVFGSIARGDDTPQSDVDYLVELEKGRTLLDLGGALIQLQELLGRKVDIVTRKGLHWYLHDNVPGFFLG